MKKNTLKNIFRRTGAFFAAVTVTAAALATHVTADYQDEIDRLQSRQAALVQERRELEASMKEYENSAAEHEEYLRIYNEKMKVQEEQITNIKEQIAILDGEIADYEQKIAEKEKEVEKGVEEFKKRLRVMYMNGNDSIASMLVGATDFYDILARTELVERVSRHDNDMIDELKSRIVDLNADKAALEESRLAAVNKKEEAEEILSDLQKTYAEHEETKAWYEAQAEYSRQRSEDMKAEESQVEEELADFIRKQQEENERKREEERKRREEERKRKEEERRRKEEEERKKREEEERRRAEEEERKRQEAEAEGLVYVPEEADETPTFDISESKDEDTYDDEDDYEDYATGGSEGFIWPCPTVINMTDGYGYRNIAEEGGASNFHKGIDINKPNCAGEPIVASAGGTVITASNTGNGYGIHVVIDHGGKISTLYGHMSECCVSVGENVKQGQKIGYIGCTGYAYGNHCHFEVRVNGEHTNPLNYVSMG